MEEITLQQAEDQPTEPATNAIDEAYMQKITDLEAQVADQKKDLERANAAFKNLLENRNSDSVANEAEDSFLTGLKRLIKR